MTTRRATLALACALLAVGVPGHHALAADLGGGPRGRSTPPPPDYSAPTSAEVQRWAGFYVGATGGYTLANTSVGGDSGSFSFDQDGWAATVLAGYNWQMGATVFGIEADLGTGDYSNSTTGAAGISSELNWISSLRARAGFLVMPSLLLYATAGVAWAEMDFKLNDVSASETFFGYQVGGGAEMAFTPNVSLRLEYIYTDLQSESLSHNGINNAYDPDFHTVRAGLAIKF